MRTNRAAWLVVAAAVALAPRGAFASTDYPSVLQSFWHMGKKPLPVPGLGCRLCHQNDSGGIGTATKPFGVTLRKNGALGANPSSLQHALDYVRVHATNSDGDPISDYQEIVIDGTDPNDAHAFVPPPPPPPPSNGGQGGQAGESGAGGDTTGAVIEPTSDTFEPTELPPPYTHGCSLGRHPRAPGVELGMLLGLGALLFRRRR